MQTDRGAALRWGLGGLLIGVLFGQSTWATLSGAAIGALFGLGRAAAQRAAALERALARIEAHLAGREPTAAPAPRAEAPVFVPPPPVAPPPAQEPARVEISPSAYHVPTPTPAVPSGPSLFDRGLAAARDFLFGGNTVVRAGVLVLLIGVALLAKWAADHDLFPIQARLASAAAIGLALTAVGYRLRDARPGFATTLQGGGIAALYLVVFFAYRGFALVPAPLAFGLFVAIAFACGVLAVVQDSQPLIFIGSVGGFLAPILASTGQGQHVILFSYYLLLDAAVAAVAWRKSWRALNLLAFVSTYAVATIWGVLSYEPKHFATTEPFLLAFMVLFTGVALVNAWRATPRLAGQGGRRPTRSEPKASEGGPLHGMVDGTLVFGTPLVTLLAQARLLEDTKFGMAISAVGFGLFYAVLATWVWQRGPETLRRVGEAFVALAIAFGTIAIPLALDDALTTTLVWSLEGAGLYWVGARQRRWLARLSGVGLQALAAFSFVWAAELAGFTGREAEFLPIANARFLSGAGLALAGLFIAREAYAARHRISETEWQLTQLLAPWGLAWWGGVWIAEIDQFVATEWQVPASLALAAATFVALERVAAVLDWLPGRLLALAIVPVAFFALPLAADQTTHLLEGGSAIAWPVLVAAVYEVARRLEMAGVAWTRWAYAPALWLAALVVGIGLAGLADVPFGLDGDWPMAAFAIGPALALLVSNQLMDGPRHWGGPFARLPDVQLGASAAPIAALAALTILAFNLSARGDADPLLYLPILSPIDIAIALLFVALADWAMRLVRSQPPVWPGEWRGALAPTFVLLAFVWQNGMIVRAVVQWAGVPFSAEALWESTPLQAALSISWTLVALAGMLACTRRGWRTRWIAAASLLGVTVAKLFVVDLATLSTGAKIATFLVVGALLLVVGYLSPVPPAAAQRGEPDAA